MSATPTRVIVFGIDGGVAHRVYEGGRSGLLPNLGRWMERGVHAANCLACYPTLSSTNWATLATGSWPGTHGVVDDRLTTEGLGEEERLLDISGLRVENVWKACRRGGRKVVLLRWSAPVAVPRPLPAEPVVAGGEEGPGAYLDLVEAALKAGVAEARRALGEPWEVCLCRVDLLEGFYRRQAGPGEGGDLEVYRRIDRAMGEVVAAIQGDPLVVVVSTHGVKPRGRPAGAANLLEQAGLLAWKPAADGMEHAIDWSRTRAAPRGTASVVVNLRGREPQGIVDPGTEYETVVQSIIDAFHDYTDPETGLKPINLALRAEDMRILGLYGDGVGDVVYALDPRFGPEWGAQLPASHAGEGDLRGLFVMAGPGVKKGIVLERNVWLTDVVPTLCHLAELPVPRGCEGAVLYQALEDPDAKTEELALLRTKLAALKQIVERPAMMC